MKGLITKCGLWHWYDQSWLLNVDFILFITLKPVEMIHLKILIVQILRGQKLPIRLHCYSEKKQFLFSYKSLWSAGMLLQKILIVLWWTYKTGTTKAWKQCNNEVQFG